MRAADPNTPTGRSAVLIQGLALGCGAILAAASYFSNDLSGDVLALFAVTGSAALVGVIWSLILALRAILSPAPVMFGRWPVAVFYLCLLELGIASGMLWVCVLEPNALHIINLAVYVGVPVFGPFLAFVAAVAGPFSYRRFRKMEARETAENVKPRERKAWKAGWIRFAWLTLALGFIFLPGPLFLLGMSWQFYDEDDGDSTGWAGAWSEVAPIFIRDGMETFLNELARLKTESFMEMQRDILAGGKVSAKRLSERFNEQANPVSAAAWEGLTRRHPEAALRCAQGMVREIKTLESGANREAVKLLARHGTVEDLHHVLDAGRTGHGPNWTRRVLLEYIEDNPHFLKIVPDLVRLSRDGVALDEVLPALARSAPADDVIKVWKNLSVHTSVGNRNVAARNVVWCVLRDVLEPALMFLENQPRFVRRATLVPLALRRGGLRVHLYRNPQNSMHLKLIRQLRAQLYSADMDALVAAMVVLGDIFREGEADGVRDRSARKLLPRTADWDEQEFQEIERVREAVKAWLAKAE